MRLSRATLLAAFVAGLAAVGPGAAPASAAADLSGPWRLEFRERAGAKTTYLADCVWEQEGRRLTGSCTSGFASLVTLRGTVRRSRVEFRFTSGLERGTVMTFAGRLNDPGDAVDGTWQSTGSPAGAGGGSFTAIRR